MTPKLHKAGITEINDVSFGEMTEGFLESINAGKSKKARRKLARFLSRHEDVFPVRPVPPPRAPTPPPAPAPVPVVEEPAPAPAPVPAPAPAVSAAAAEPEVAVAASADDAADRRMTDAEFAEDYSGLKVSALRARCTKFGLDSTGKKKDLLERLQANTQRETQLRADEAEAAAAAAGEAEQAAAADNGPAAEETPAEGGAPTVSAEVADLLESNDAGAACEAMAAAGFTTIEDCAARGKEVEAILKTMGVKKGKRVKIIAGTEKMAKERKEAEAAEAVVAAAEGETKQEATSAPADADPPQDDMGDPPPPASGAAALTVEDEAPSKHEEDGVAPTDNIFGTGELAEQMAAMARDADAETRAEQEAEKVAEEARRKEESERLLAEQKEAAERHAAAKAAEQKAQAEEAERVAKEAQKMEEEKRILAEKQEAEAREREAMEALRIEPGSNVLIRGSEKNGVGEVVHVKCGKSDFTNIQVAVRLVSSPGLLGKLTGGQSKAKIEWRKFEELVLAPLQSSPGGLTRAEWCSYFKELANQQIGHRSLVRPQRGSISAHVWGDEAFALEQPGSSPTTDGAVWGVVVVIVPAQGSKRCKVQVQWHVLESHFDQVAFNALEYMADAAVAKCQKAEKKEPQVLNLTDVEVVPWSLAAQGSSLRKAPPLLSLEPEGESRSALG